jgi:Zn2+/Cd2+-exporting ATPase
MRQRAYRIRGIDCAEEVAALKCEVCPLLGTDGKVTFDLINGKMTLDLPEESIPDSEIVQAVAQTGMEAVPWRKQVSKQSGAAGLWRRHGRMAMAMASGIVCVFGFAMIPSGASIWTTRTLETSSVSFSPTDVECNS